MSNTPDPNDATLSEGELRLLGKLDERTERIDKNVDEVAEATKSNAEKIKTNSERVKRNTTILGGYSAGLMALMMWGADKISRVI